MADKSLSRQAPYLRRYARALTGSQIEGDAFVQVAFEALLEGTMTLDRAKPLRLELFRVFHAVWRRSLNGHSIDAPRRKTVADARLQRLTPEHRTVILLVLMEGFTLSEAADVLSVDESEAQSRFDAAQADIESQLATDVLIVEDEPVIALDIERIVGEMGHRVVGVAATRDAAVEMAASHKPGLILADVRLADGSSGADAARDILERVDVPVIFVTAYPERLLTGQKPEPTFLVTKPFAPETLKAVVGQALFFHQPKSLAPVFA